MSFYPDMGYASPVATGQHVRAIGWLHPNHAYTQGEVSVEFLTRLNEFIARGTTFDSLCFPGFGGFHTCEFCEKVHGIRNFGVPSSNLLFIFPEMIIHYVQQHGYRPPAEFVDAILATPLPDTEEYKLLTEPFWHLHKRA